MPNFSLSDSIFEAAADKFATPFHLYDEAGLRQNARDLNKAFSWCPDFKEYFAVKALPNPTILRILKEEGCGVDCSSETELMLARACGFQGEEIMFSANAMPYHEFTLAREMEARCLTYLNQRGDLPTEQELWNIVIREPPAWFQLVVFPVARQLFTLLTTDAE